MAQRVTYRRRLAYNTRSNKTRVIKTPGNNLRSLHIKKQGKIPRCGDTGVPLQGIPAMRPREFARLSRTKKTVQRAYGGCLSANAVKDRIVRAFLIEEQKIVKQKLKQMAQK
ncbi:60S ribosomal protein L34 [Schizosaccharomyces japonicus yFS275]|uniref:60S ribosomal protein L34 n=1 Tax=Schizosaccharomyces japonicus (strain yFS275 / FY16936) TaxID=402676 RepID=B6JZ30_SCHJY|nr:60S ribosomal protein L34 [Schizosaccharomyces japonicus yFS275]EEB06798.1 60S ribosomal protein L34 [Schizosaccharomyces japonicus yFS275]